MEEKKKGGGRKIRVWVPRTLRKRNVDVVVRPVDAIHSSVEFPISYLHDKMSYG